MFVCWIGAGGIAAACLACSRMRGCSVFQYHRGANVNTLESDFTIEFCSIEFYLLSFYFSSFIAYFTVVCVLDWLLLGIATACLAYSRLRAEGL